MSKLERLLKLGIIPAIKCGIDKEPRIAMAYGMSEDIFDTWTDFGRYYTITFKGMKEQYVPRHEVCSVVIDRILAVKDPVGETEDVVEESVELESIEVDNSPEAAEESEVLSEPEAAETPEAPEDSLPIEVVEPLEEPMTMEELVDSLPTTPEDIEEEEE